MANTPAERVTVSLAGGRGYDVVIGRGVIEALGAELRGVLPVPRDACVVVDRVFTRWGDLPGLASLSRAGFRSWTADFEAGESCKSLAGFEQVLRALAMSPIDRNGPVVVIGGGTLGDAAGFAAAVYRRGVPVVLCPTTLLAMVDASVGGKTGVNIDVAMGGETEVFKNMAGAFHQPRLVVIDVDFLQTLPARHVRAGLAECIKHGMMAGSVPRPAPDLAAWTRANMARVLAGDAAALIELVTRHVRLKAGVVEADEFETANDEAGGRALLNLGHTFGHAIEPLDGLTLEDGTPGPLLHGEAVGLGLIAASVAARELGLCDVVGATTAAVRAAGLPTRVAGLPGAETLIQRMMYDKKSVGGQLRLVLPTGEGAAAVVRGPDMRAVVAGLDAIRMGDAPEGIEA